MKGSLSAARQELEFRRCRASENYFIENYWLIRVPGKGLVPLRLRPAQIEILETWRKNRYALLLKARQIGFSTLVSAHEVWLASFHPDKFIVMLSRTERDSRKLLLKSKVGWKHLPDWLKAKLPKLLDNNMQTMTWDNGSSIESLPSASDPARGESVDEVVVDEWAFLPNPEEAWASIEPVTDIGGRVIGGSTANGSGDFFEGMYTRAKSGKGQFKAMFYSWRAATERDDAWYEAKKESMLEWQLHQEYPSDDVECFIKSGNVVFSDLDVVKQHLRPPMVGMLVHRDISDKDSDFYEGNGHLRVWEKPVVGYRYVIGADVAEGLEHGDYSSAHVIKIQNPKGVAAGERDTVVAKWHGHIAPDLYGSGVLRQLGYWYGQALVGVESNNHGLTTLTYLRDSHYPNIYYRRTAGQRTELMTKIMGVHTNKATKPQMVDSLAQSLRFKDGLPDLWMPDAEALDELMRYVRDGDGKMHGSPFDDQVMSLAIANWMRRFAYTSDFVEPPSDVLTWGHIMAELDAKVSQSPRMGQHSRRAA